MKNSRQEYYLDIFGDPDAADWAVEAWERAILHLEVTGNLTPPREEIADRYARACAEYAVLHPEAVRAGPVKIGPNGGDVFNFYWSAVEKLNDRIAKFEAKLGIDVDRAEGPRAAPSKATAADEFLED